MSAIKLTPSILSKKIVQQVEFVTCPSCCKYFIVPMIASCSHTLCHTCWLGRRTCLTCGTSVDHKSLKINNFLKILTEHTKTFVANFEDLYSIKLEEFIMDFEKICVQPQEDPINTVKNWLASSMNQFSDPMTITSQEIGLGNPLVLNASNVQIHTHTKKVPSPKNVVHVAQSQEDWDKIEILPDTEDICAKNKENIAGPMDIEPFYIEENDFSVDNPRRSSRKKDLKTDSINQINDLSEEKHNSKKSESEKKSSKPKKGWNNVNKMRKEFSKLSKVNKNKLNVSIETCKKAQANRSKDVTPLALKQNDDIDENILNLLCNKELTSNTVLRKNDSNIKNKQLSDDSGKDCNIIANMNKNKQTKDSIIEERESIDRNIKAKMNKEINDTVIEEHKFNDQPTHLEKNKQKKDSVTEERESIDCNINVNMNNNNQTKDRVIEERESVDQPISLENMNLKNNEIPIKTNILHSISNHNEKKCVLPVSFLKKSNLHTVQFTSEIDNNNAAIDNTAENTDDIEISIKIGSTIANITIKKKNNDVQLKVHADQEIQTSLGPQYIREQKDASCSPLHKVDVSDIEINLADQNNSNTDREPVSKTISTKKNTESADTAIVNFEITESVAKGLSDSMECVETKHVNKSSLENTRTSQKTVANFNSPKKDVKEIDDEIPEDDLDLDNIFDSGSISEQQVVLLKDTKDTPSEILPTMKSKKSQKTRSKRSREPSQNEVPSNKKQKIGVNTEIIEQVPAENDSEHMTYDVVMSQVFANIDADIRSQNSEKHTPIKHTTNKKDSPKNRASQTELSQDINSTHKTSVVENDNEKYSENVFSLLENDATKQEKQVAISTQQHIDNLLTPGICRDLEQSVNINSQNEVEAVQVEPDCGTPMDQNDDVLDVVEDTPQKNHSRSAKKVEHAKPVNKSVGSIQNAELNQDSQIIKSIINISDTTGETNKDATVIKAVGSARKKSTSETPMTMTHFINNVTHNSTPVAKKALNFDNESIEDLEQTFCPTTTQEKEFINKAFERTPKSLRGELDSKNLRGRQRKFCLAGSCLSPTDLDNLKLLCMKRGWIFSHKYTPDLTHLVVTVDNENRAQRSVKYMCALASSKWIVSYAWADKCLKVTGNVDEGSVVKLGTQFRFVRLSVRGLAQRPVLLESFDWLPYEVLDVNGPGPRLSRMAHKKLFQGLTFYCMPPFSILDVDTLKFILLAAGAKVVDDVKEINIVSEADGPAFLLAEPENTQEHRFLSMTFHHKIVPVNYEWILFCLGSYTLCPVNDLLLCPFDLIPEPAKRWSRTLIDY